jgi:hypothetical protein
MKSNGFSVTFWFSWLLTLFALFAAFSVFVSTAQGPAIVMAAGVLTVVSLALLVIVPVIMLSILRDSRRSADYLKELANRKKADS